MKKKTTPLFIHLSFFKGISLIILIFFLACTPSSTKVDIQDTLEELPAGSYLTIPPENVSPQMSLRILDSYIKDNPSSEENFRDIRLILLAQIGSLDTRTSDGRKKSLILWADAMAAKTSEDFSKLAFESWLEAYGKFNERVLDPDILVQLILAETQQGKVSVYLQKNNLGSPKRMLSIIRKTIPQWISSAASSDTLYAPKALPSKDILLIETAKSKCQSTNIDPASWDKWEQMLTPEVRAYFQALVDQCLKQTEKAMNGFHLSANKMKRIEKNAPFALEAFSRLASMQRTAGLRREAAETYIELCNLWDSPFISASSLGIPDRSFYKRKINDLLWASRYRSMVADYEKAKILAQRAILVSQEALSTSISLNEESKRELEDFKAEAYHTMANRIAVEQKKWESASSLNLMGLGSPQVSHEWRFRLEWLAGLYEYVGGNFSKAKEHWINCLDNPHESSQIPMTIFWLSLAELKLDQKEKSDNYLSKLLKHFPLSYYSTVAPVIANLKTTQEIHANLESFFGESREKHRKFLNHGRISVSEAKKILSKEPNLAPSILRIEVINKLKNRPLMLAAAKEFESVLRDLTERKSLTASVEEAGLIYAARVFFVAGKYLSTISITHRISQKNGDFWRIWPDHIHFFFPKPFTDIYKDSAAEFDLDAETLLAISRQESAFSASIESHAGALGIMQLMRTTAKKYADILKISSHEIDSVLSDPKVNIRLGAMYLSTLSRHYRNFTPAIYAGYNAGENAVDQWIKYRSHSNHLIFVELIPFGETKDYVKNVWRNRVIYQFLNHPGSDSDNLKAPAENVTKNSGSFIPLLTNLR